MPEDRERGSRVARARILVGNATTLIALAGITVGLVKCFGALRVEAPAAKATILAAGISEATHLTIIGLAVVLPAILIYSALVGRPPTRD